MNTRDQQRARHAYECVAALEREVLDEYKIVVNDFGSNILRGGVAAAISWLERGGKEPAVNRFLEHLAAAGVPYLPTTSKDLPDRVRKLGVLEYMLVSREMVRTIVWFKRAVQARGAADGRERNPNAQRDR